MCTMALRKDMDGHDRPSLKNEFLKSAKARSHSYEYRTTCPDFAWSRTSNVEIGDYDFDSSPEYRD